jgi:hypothetical protein
MDCLFVKEIKDHIEERDQILHPEKFTFKEKDTYLKLRMNNMIQRTAEAKTDFRYLS